MNVFHDTNDYTLNRQIVVVLKNNHFIRISNSSMLPSRLHYNSRFSVGGANIYSNNLLVPSNVRSMKENFILIGYFIVGTVFLHKLTEIERIQ